MKEFLLPLLLALCLILPSCEGASSTTSGSEESGIPAYSGEAYVVLNDNQPDFDEDDLTTVSFETYSELDALGRCGVAFANVGTDLMPTEERGSISEVHPTGWQSVSYDIVDGGYLYNRCHLIGYQLTAENANEKNLITGTRYLNVEGMLPFENMVADYVKETGNHVLYRVTPVFEGDNLVASGVELEALSVEDNGEGILFHVYCYNVQPGVTIDYATGESCLSGEEMAAESGSADSAEPEESAVGTYILNTNTMRFHLPDCSGVSQMSEANKEEYTGNRADLIAQGYVPCQQCNP
ncbi:MAG: DNA/RNA non-specific endonuclease [Oscillospiraceae bacterium]|nr:DNA/RNA non-specific endonuclease [Oscillospiraceae bacterium]